MINPKFNRPDNSPWINTYISMLPRLHWFVEIHDTDGHGSDTRLLFNVLMAGLLWLYWWFGGSTPEQEAVYRKEFLWAIERAYEKIVIPRS